MSADRARDWAESQAVWDEGHIKPAAEAVADHPRSSDAKILEQLADDLDNYRSSWESTHEDEIDDLGGVTIDQVWGWYRAEYLRRNERRLTQARSSPPLKNPGDGVARMRKNPASPETRKAAIEKFEQFHRYPPTKLTEFRPGFAIPRQVFDIGPAKWTTYRSGKVDPATLKKPARPVDYIHEHDAGVRVYLPTESPDVDEVPGAKDAKVPRAYFAVEALVKLGDALGFCAKGRGADDLEFECLPREELYCVPDGTCLVIVAKRREVVAMIWGGALGVFGRGIDG